MILVRCDNNFCIMDGEKKLLETGVIGADFILSFYTDKPIILTENLDKSLYDNLGGLFDNNYVFMEDGFSYRQGDTITFLSDQCCDFSNSLSVDKVSRLIISKRDGEIEVRCWNPFCEKCNIKKDFFTVAFSPCGNGNYSKNLKTGLSFQDDFIIACCDVVKENNGKVFIKKEECR